MSDTRLRDLERSAAAGDGEAAVRYLHERMRGGLSEERVELLAYCLHPPACAALGWERVKIDVPEAPTAIFRRPGQGDMLYQVSLDPPGWSHGLRRWGRESAIRAGLAAAHFRFSVWERLYDRIVKDHPFPLKKESVVKLLANLEGVWAKPTVDTYWYSRSGTDLMTITIINAVEDIPGGREDGGLIPVFVASLAKYAHSHKDWQLGAALRDCVGHGKGEALLAAIRAELVPWVLGWVEPRQGGGL